MLHLHCLLYRHFPLGLFLNDFKDKSLNGKSPVGSFVLAKRWACCAARCVPVFFYWIGKLACSSRFFSLGIIKTAISSLHIIIKPLFPPLAPGP